MATQLWPPGTTGIRRWSGGVARDGYRDYKLTLLVQGATGAAADGPANVLRTSGVPAIGSAWAPLGDSDQWVWRTPETTVTPVLPDDPNKPVEFHELELTFSNRPPEIPRCQTDSIDNPLLEPARVSGSSVRYTEEAVKDRFGNFIKNSAHEQIRGAQVEFEVTRASVRIEQNVATAYLGVTLPYQFRDTLNSVPMWGFPPRAIKHVPASWEKKYYGTCLTYYSRVLEFEIYVVKNHLTGLYESGWDRKPMDEGSKALQGHWDGTTGAYVIEQLPDGSWPDPANPAHFRRFTDRESNPMRVILNGFGLPVGAVVTGTVGPGTTVPCCVDPVGSTLRAKVTDKTGDCTCIPDTFAMELDEDSPGNVWIGDLLSAGGCGLEAHLTCNLAGSSCADFDLSFPSCSGVSVIFNNVDCDCSPMSLEFNVTMAGDCCNGTFTVTIGLEPITTIPGFIPVEKYDEANLFLLGIPAIL